MRGYFVTIGIGLAGGSGRAGRGGVYIMKQVASEGERGRAAGREQASKGDDKALAGAH